MLEHGSFCVAVETGDQTSYYKVHEEKMKKENHFSLAAKINTLNKETLGE